jgi:hypothetical protein
MSQKYEGNEGKRRWSVHARWSKRSRWNVNVQGSTPQSGNKNERENEMKADARMREQGREPEGESLMANERSKRKGKAIRRRRRIGRMEMEQ